MFSFGSPPMAKIDSMVKRVAPTDLGVLITGESGVGKELIARRIHSESPRRDEVFVKINSAAIPNSLFENELYGHRKGAFTGAGDDRKGHVELAHRGTLFFDEIGELNLDSQTKLLHMLQDGEFIRLGSNLPVKVDVRIVSATNRDMAFEVQRGRFREDLYYRLNVVNIHVPPLRECKADIPGLTAYFLKQYAQEFEKDTVPPPRGEQYQLMSSYDWPGNVRELENFVKKLVLVEDRKPAFEDLKSRIEDHDVNHGRRRADTVNGLSLRDVTRQVEREVEKKIISRVLERNGWNRKITAENLQISYRSLLDKIKKLEIE